MDDAPTVEQRATQLARRIEEDAADAYAEFGRRILLHPTSIPYLQKTVLWYLGEYFDTHAKWYLSEVSRYEQIHASYAPLLVELAAQTVKRSEEMRADWSILARVGVQGTMQILLQARIHHWEALALRQIRKMEEGASNKQPEAIPRRSYRLEVRAWMEEHTISSVEIAAKRLGVGYSTLKSIMTDKGSARYSQETLEMVLKTITSPTGE